jgi:enoyl-CoA hydratase
VLDVENVTRDVCRFTFVSPADRNALSAAMRERLLQALGEARASGVKVVIVRGSDGVFSSGYKIDPDVMRPSSVMEDRARLVEVADFHRRYREQPVITIAEVRGHCVAGGTDLMLASDLAIVADDASIAVPNVRGLGITLLLPLWSWLVGPQRAKLLALTGDPARGDEVAKLGLVAASLPESILEERVVALAERIAMMPPELLDVVKQALNVAWDAAGMSTALLRAAELDALSHASRPVTDFWADVEDMGIRAAVRARDGQFLGNRALDLLKGASGV